MAWPEESNFPFLVKGRGDTSQEPSCLKRVAKENGSPYLLMEWTGGFSGAFEGLEASPRERRRRTEQRVFWGESFFFNGRNTMPLSPPRRRRRSWPRSWAYRHPPFSSLLGSLWLRQLQRFCFRSSSHRCPYPWTIPDPAGVFASCSSCRRRFQARFHHHLGSIRPQKSGAFRFESISSACWAIACNVTDLVSETLDDSGFWGY